MCSAFALITGGLQAATPVLFPNVIYLALWPHSGVRCGILVCGQCATGEADQEVCAVCMKCPTPGSAVVPKPTKAPVGAGLGLASPAAASSTQFTWLIPLHL